jgi:hypothetical protein
MFGGCLRTGIALARAPERATVSAATAVVFTFKNHPKRAPATLGRDVSRQASEHQEKVVVATGVPRAATVLVIFVPFAAAPVKPCANLALHDGHVYGESVEVHAVDVGAVDEQIRYIRDQTIPRSRENESHAPGQDNADSRKKRFESAGRNGADEHANIANS